MSYGLLFCLIGLAPPLAAEQAAVPETTRVLPPATALPTYQVLRTDAGIAIDGRLAETDWQKTPPIDFITPWNDTARDGAQSTVARLLWDDDNLYIIYECVDPYLDSEVVAHDGPVYAEDAVEIFATPNPDDVGTYFGYEMNINSALLDYIAFGGGAEWTPNIFFPWQSEGVQIATSYDGTLNDHVDTDRGWILEIAIPLDNFRHVGGRIPPRDGDTWRAALNRTAGHQGQYGLWSDTRTPKAAFHHAAYFGILAFAAKTVGR